MNTIRFSWKKIFCLLVLLFFSYLILRTFIFKPTRNVKRVRYDRKPVFRADDTPGNFEVVQEDRYGPGEGGKGHRVKPEQKGEERRLTAIYGFNQLVSDEISLDRTVPDMRQPECKHWDYPDDLPTATIVFIFHNEGWSTLFRSVHSVINRSPPQLLHEIVLVDDKSEFIHLHDKLDEEIKKPYYQGKVKVVRNKQREGLIRSRNNGAIAATGEVVIFLDAHCEVGLNWLPPLLAPIHEDEKTLSVPVIDGVEWDDFSIKPVYSQGKHSRGIFEWGMLYKEGPLPEKEAVKRKYHSEPYNSPTHAGGLFAIKRSWFKELGWYDPGLQIWGGENYELAFKLWQCGGRSVWVPCSRIGHVYRGHSCSSCHSGGVTEKWGGVPLALRNYKRLIETWWDEKYKQYFYTREPIATFIDMGDISKQKAIKERLQCKSFTWFMEEVAYDVLDKYPELPPNAFWGEISNTPTRQCVDTRHAHPPSEISVSGCHGYGGSQLIRLNTAGQLASGEWCIEYLPPRSKGAIDGLQLIWCNEGDASGHWSFEGGTGFLKHKKLPLKCLMVTPDTYKLVMRDCDSSSKYQKWTFNNITPVWAAHQYKEE